MRTRPASCVNWARPTSRTASNRDEVSTSAWCGTPSACSKRAICRSRCTSQCCTERARRRRGHASELIINLGRRHAGRLTWSAFGCGPTAMAITSMAIHMGGQCAWAGGQRLLEQGRACHCTNYEFVERVVRLANEFNRPIANVDEARQILGLRPRSKDHLRKHRRPGSCPAASSRSPRPGTGAAAVRPVAGTVSRPEGEEERHGRTRRT